MQSLQELEIRAFYDTYHLGFKINDGDEKIVAVVDGKKWNEGKCGQKVSFAVSSYNGFQKLSICVI